MNTKKDKSKVEQAEDVLAVIIQPKIYLYVGIIAGVGWLFMALLCLFGPASIFDFTEYIQRIAASCPFLCLDIAMWFFCFFSIKLENRGKKGQIYIYEYVQKEENI